MSGDFPEGPGGYGPGSVLAGYRLEALVGVGGMAAVWQARSLRLGRPVALKILASALATDEAFRLRFIAEARAAALVDDPHIIPVYDADEADGVLFIAMRFVGGGDLRRLVEREGALPPGRAANFISPVASALDAAHAAGLVHRDVKPANILVDMRAGRPDHVYLSDFGIAKAASSMNLTAVGQALGTPDYMAPEQIEGHTVDGRTDQYALACVTYRLLTEHGPFERESALSVMAAHLYAPPPSLAARRPDLPVVIDEVLAKAMAKSPADRYESCGDFAEALRQALGLAPYIPRPRGAEPVPPRPPASAPVTPHPLTTSTADPLTPARPPAPTERPAPTEVPAPTGRPAPAEPFTPAEPSAPAQSSAPATVATALAATRAPVSADVPPSLTDPAPSPATIPPPAEPNTMTISPAHGVRTADIVARPEAPGDAAPRPAAREADDDAGLRTPTVAARPSVPMPAAAAHHTITEVAGPQSSQEPPNAPEPLDESQAPDEPGASEVSDESAALDEPDEPAVSASIAEAAVESEVLYAPPEMPPDPAADELQQSGPGSDTAETRGTAEPPGFAEHADVAAEMSAPTVVTEPVETTDAPETSAADDADLTGAPGEARDAAEVRTAYEPRLSMTPDTVRDAVDVPAEQGELTDPGLASDAAPTIELRPPADANPPDEATVWSRHRRLSSVAAVCAVAVVAAVVPFVLISGAHSPSSGQSPGPTSSPRPSRTQGRASSSPYTRVPVNLPAAYGGVLSSMAFSPDGTTLAIAGGAGAGEACLWNIAAARCTANFPIAHSVAFSPNGATVAVTNSDSGTAEHGSIRLWNVATGKLTATLTDLHSQGAYSAAFTANGKVLVVGDANDSIFLWDVATGTETTRITSVDHAGFAAVACSPLGATMAAGDVDGTTYLVNVATKEQMFTVTTSAATATDPHPLMVNSVAFSHDGTTLAIGDINGTIVLINMAAQKASAPLSDPGGKGADSVAFSPDGAMLAVADANGNTYLWDVATRKVIDILPDPGGKGVTSVAFSPDGKILATGDEDGSANLWYGHFG